MAMIGVMPAPAANATTWRGVPSPGGRTKRPVGGITSIVAPALSVSLAQLEKRPSATRLMATRRCASSGPQQIE